MGENGEGGERGLNSGRGRFVLYSPGSPLCRSSARWALSPRNQARPSWRAAWRVQMSDGFQDVGADPTRTPGPPASESTDGGACRLCRTCASSFSQPTSPRLPKSRRIIPVSAPRKCSRHRLAWKLVAPPETQPLVVAQQLTSERCLPENIWNAPSSQPWADKSALHVPQRSLSCLAPDRHRRVTSYPRHITNHSASAQKRGGGAWAPCAGPDDVDLGVSRSQVA